jgi:hypothetical protein
LRVHFIRLGPALARKEVEMHRRKLVLLVAVVGNLAVGIARADEVIHFKNGTYLAIRAHEVKGDMVYVTLAADAVMAFPMKMVDRIEPATFDGAPGGATRAAGGTALPSGGGSDYQGLVPGYQRVPTAGSGEMAVGRPFAGSGDSREKITVVGEQSVVGGNRMGSSVVINPEARTHAPITLRPRFNAGPPPPEPPPAGSSDEAPPPEEASPPEESGDEAPPPEPDDSPDGAN